jgi:hypothetical protein
MVGFSQLIRSAPVQDIEFPEEKVINEELSLWVISAPVATKGIKPAKTRIYGLGSSRTSFSVVHMELAHLTQMPTVGHQALPF